MNFSHGSLICLFLFTLILPLLAQIPNAGFEQWTAGNPDQWLTYNLIGFAVTITQVSPGHSGTSALQGQVITDVFNDTIPPVLISGLTGQGFSISSRFGSLTGYYKYFPEGGDEFALLVFVFKDSSVIGGGELYLTAGSSNFSQFTMPISYFTSDVPDQALITMTIEDPMGSIAHPGSYFIIDDLAFSQTTDIQEVTRTIPKDYQLDQNYPNPFNPVTHIRYGLPSASNVNIEVYNSLGQSVTVLENDYQTAGYHTVSFDGSQLPSGIYFYRIDAGSYHKVMKMMLVK